VAIEIKKGKPDGLPFLIGNQSLLFKRAATASILDFLICDQKSLPRE
jgi:hypothetical protein